jgi:hypothetical protein
VRNGREIGSFRYYGESDVLLFDHPSTFVCILVGAFAIPALGRLVLAFLRDLDDYLEKRSKR